MLNKYLTEKIIPFLKKNRLNSKFFYAALLSIENLKTITTLFYQYNFSISCIIFLNKINGFVCCFVSTLVLIFFVGNFLRQVNRFFIFKES